jgi:hypothetical protein
VETTPPLHLPATRGTNDHNNTYGARPNEMCEAIYSYTQNARVFVCLSITASTIALMMEAASTSETSVNFYQTWLNIIEDSHIHIRRSENVKSHLIFS